MAHKQLQEVLDDLWRKDSTNVQALVDYLNQALEAREEIFSLHEALTRSKWIPFFSEKDLNRHFCADKSYSPRLLEAMEADSIAQFEIERALIGKQIGQRLVHILWKRNAWRILCHLLNACPKETLVLVANMFGVQLAGGSFFVVYFLDGMEDSPKWHFCEFSGISAEPV